MKRMNLRLDVTEAERDLIRKAAALSNHRSMAEFCRSVVLKEARNVAGNVAQIPSKDSQTHQEAE